MLSSLSKLALALAGGAWLARGIDVSLNFYTGIDCKTASSITPSAALNLSTCIVTPGLVSLHYETVPCAGGGIVIPYLFKDTSCGTQQDILDFYKTGSDFHCLSDFESGSIASIMLSCNQDDPEKPQSTSTVSVGQVATGAPAPTASGSSSSGASNDNHNDDSSSKSGWNALSLGARIGIIVAAAVVGASLLAALCWRLLCGGRPPRRNRYDERPYNPPASAPYNTPMAHQYPYPNWKAPTATATPANDVVSPVSTHHTGSAASPPPLQPWELPQGDRPWELPSGEQPSELPGFSPASAYIQVLDNIVGTARQHAASGQLDTGVSGVGSASTSNALPPNVVSTAFMKHDPEWKHRLGAAGELYMFEYLQSLGLPDFGRGNWTSSLRSIVGVYPGYQSIGAARDGIADIEYYDEHGVFTDFLLARGYAIQGLQPGMRPTYRFEVKATTSNNWRAPFYMSDNQERHIQEATITSHQPDQIYIICRISGLGSGNKTSLHIYLDPNAHRRDGRLVFTRTEGEEGPYWTVRPA